MNNEVFGYIATITTGKGLFTPSDPVTDPVTLTGKMGMQHILLVTVLVKHIKGAIRQRYVIRSVSTELKCERVRQMIEVILIFILFHKSVVLVSSLILPFY